MRIKRTRGQNLYFFLGLAPILLVALGLVVDFGRYMILHAQAAALADMASISAANAVDLLASTPGAGKLNKGKADEFARSVISTWIEQRLPYEQWMTISVDHIETVGNKVRVVIHAECQPIFLGAFGVGPFSIDVDSYARAAVGISREGS